MSNKKLKQIDEAWLGVDFTDKDLFNPMSIVHSNDEDFHLKLTWLMTRPEYFSFLVKEIFNIQLLPSQALILYELWNRKFPMLIASRGFGKSFILSLYALMRAVLLPGRKVVVVGAAFRQSKVLFEYMETIWNNSPILRDLCTGASGPRRDVDRCVMRINDSRVTCLPLGDGCLLGDTLITKGGRFAYIKDGMENIDLNEDHQVFLNDDYSLSRDGFRESDESYYNGIRNTLDIHTKKGYKISGTYNHKIQVVRDSQVKWCRFDELEEGDNVLINRRKVWHNVDRPDIGIDESYACGLLTGDGCWTNKYFLGFATGDIELAEYLKGLNNKWKQCKTDPCHWKMMGKDNVNEWLDRWELSACYAKDKHFPQPIMAATKEAMAAFIQGLFDADGTLQVSTKKGGTSICVSFCNTSERLVRELQYILTHYGIISTLTFRDRDKKWNRVYELLITGKNVNIFAKEIGFRLSRKQDKLIQAISNQTRNVSSGDTIPGVRSIMLDIAKNNKGKRYESIISLSNLRRRKNITFDTLKIFLDVYSNCDDERLKTLKTLCDENVYYDKVSSIENNGLQPTYDIHIPSNHVYVANGFVSHNTKIRGQRANDILADEFASIPRDIFETVVAGFAAVSSDPVENVKRLAAAKKAEELGITIEEDENSIIRDKDNQIILSGTAYYDFNHFATYWKRWKSIINSQGDPTKLRDVFGGDEVPDNFDWREYSIIRIPYELLPVGFMDASQVARSKATVHAGIYQMEFGAVFTRDSEGFFKRSLIESCVVSDKPPVITDTKGENIVFQAKLIGDKGKRYVFGVDPASEVDNFSITVIELNADHRKIVYCWTTTRSEHKEKVKKGYVKETDFYSYCARKIRDLMRLFPCVHISMDAQGGGIAVMESLHDDDKIQEGELPIWEIIDEDKEKDTDDNRGLHILEMCQFAKHDWLAEANHSMRKDFEDKVLLFPMFDAITLGITGEQDNLKGRMYDTLEECVLEIEELKDELSMIQMTQTPAGRDKWDTPEVIVAAGKKSKMRKDRYSALLMANMAARTIMRTPGEEEYDFFGGFANALNIEQKKKMQKGNFSGPNWFVDSVDYY